MIICKQIFNLINYPSHRQFIRIVLSSLFYFILGLELELFIKIILLTKIIVRITLEH